MEVNSSTVTLVPAEKNYLKSWKHGARCKTLQRANAKDACVPSEFRIVTPVQFAEPSKAATALSMKVEARHVRSNFSISELTLKLLQPFKTL